uniref:Glycosyltransferase n=1 Tax=viral metagenome TaxID=1070528 RepID=A0A6C0DPI7_9ZZZZ
MKIPIKKDTIFISVASYRDEVCNSTLKSIYSMAANPKNIYCGVVQQNDAEKDDDCLLSSSDSSIVSENITMMRIKHYEAKGPCWARYLASTLWSGQEFFLQIDSHSRFVKDWDKKCIRMMRRLKTMGVPKAVISHYPKSIDSYNEDMNTDKPIEVTKMCQSFFNGRDMISFLGAGSEQTNDEFYETPYAAAGFLLSSYTLLDDVPFDPNLDFLFVGEEIGHSIRIWTAGYNIYTPSENIVYHEYERKGKPKVWDDNHYSDMDAFEKIKQIIGLDSDHTLPGNIKYNLDKYGLGKERTLEDYYAFAGIDLKNKRVYKNFCRKNNIATEDDIKQSNEIDHPKPETEKPIEGFGAMYNEPSKWWKIYMDWLFYLFLFIFVTLFVYFFVYVMFFLKLNKLERRSR